MHSITNISCFEVLHYIIKWKILEIYIVSKTVWRQELLNCAPYLCAQTYARFSKLIIGIFLKMMGKRYAREIWFLLVKRDEIGMDLAGFWEKKVRKNGLICQKWLELNKISSFTYLTWMTVRVMQTTIVICVDVVSDTENGLESINGGCCLCHYMVQENLTSTAVWPTRKAVIIYIVLELCITSRMNGVPPDAIRLWLFLFNLHDKVKVSYYSLDTSTITSWEDLCIKFLDKNFPLSNTIEL